MRRLIPILLIFPWLLGLSIILFNSKYPLYFNLFLDMNYYKFIILSLFVYILITFSLSVLAIKNKITSDLFCHISTNYILNQSLFIFLFFFHDFFIANIVILLLTISTIILFFKIKRIDKCFIYLLPYILWCILVYFKMLI